jgi:hypothetical protein
MPSSAGTSSVGIAPVVSGFLWRAATQDAWIALTSPDGVGAGTLSFTVAPNTGPARTGHIRVAGQLLTVMQASAASSDTPGWIALAPPIVSGDSVTLNWSLPVGGQPATSFTIVASLSPGGPPVASLPVGAVQGLTVPAPAGVYYVRVVGVNAAGAGPMSNEVVVVVGDGSLPAAPQNLTAAVTGNLFRIAWRAAINVATAPIQSYVIEAGSGPGLSDLANFATGSPETQFVTPPVPNGSYFVRLRARNRLGTGPPSGEIRVIVGPPPPNAPVLSGSVGAGGSVTLSWTAPTTGAAVIGYQLQAGTTPGSSNAAVLNLLPLQRSFATAGVPQGTYYVRVVAMSAQGPSGASNELTLSVP